MLWLVTCDLGLPMLIVASDKEVATYRYVQGMKSDKAQETKDHKSFKVREATIAEIKYLLTDTKFPNKECVLSSDTSW